MQFRNLNKKLMIQLTICKVTNFQRGIKGILRGRWPWRCNSRGFCGTRRRKVSLRSSSLRKNCIAGRYNFGVRVCSHQTSTRVSLWGRHYSICGERLKYVLILTYWIVFRAVGVLSPKRYESSQRPITTRLSFC